MDAPVFSVDVFDEVSYVCLKEVELLTFVGKHLLQTHDFINQHLSVDLNDSDSSSVIILLTTTVTLHCTAGLHFCCFSLQM